MKVQGNIQKDIPFSRLPSRKLGSNSNYMVYRVISRGLRFRFGRWIAGRMPLGSCSDIWCTRSWLYACHISADFAETILVFRAGWKVSSNRTLAPPTLKYTWVQYVWKRTGWPVCCYVPCPGPIHTRRDPVRARGGCLAVVVVVVVAKPRSRAKYVYYIFALTCSSCEATWRQVPCQNLFPSLYSYPASLPPLNTFARRLPLEEES